MTARNVPGWSPSEQGPGTLEEVIVGGELQLIEEQITEVGECPLLIEQDEGAFAGLIIHAAV